MPQKLSTASLNDESQLFVPNLEPNKADSEISPDSSNQTSLLKIFGGLVVVIITLTSMVFGANYLLKPPTSSQTVTQKMPSALPTVAIFSPSEDPSPATVLTEIPDEKTQKWLIATTAILAIQNREGLDELKTKIPKADLKMLLRDWWGITDRKTALETMDWLKTAGHSRDFNQVRTEIIMTTKNDQAEFDKLRASFPDKQSKAQLDFIWSNRTKLSKKKLMAWDLMRMANIARWSYSMGFITEVEAWEYLRYAGQKLQANYESWDEIGEHYKLGRTFWNQTTSHPDAENSLKWLKSNPKSPWLILDWRQPLN